MRGFIFFLLLLFLGFIFPSRSFAQTYTFEVTQGFSAPRPSVPGVGSVFFVKNFGIQYHGGKVWLSGSPDGTGNMNFADTLQVVKIPTGTFTYNAAPGCVLQASIPPQDITSYFTLFNLGMNPGYVRLIDWCGRTKNIGPIYITEIIPTATPTPTPTALPTPTPTPTPSEPEPFLDLPWDYESDGLTFSEAALSINSYFDHEYPLLSSGLGEPEEANQSIVNFYGLEKTTDPYSRHDGYDYGKKAKVYINEPVLAAGGGTATYVNTCGACGNMILIDHGNGYQTRYLHLQPDGLITKTPGEEVEVSQGDVIGMVGATGNVVPKGELGAHIHFGIFQDKDEDGSFGDNIPDGVTDPFGWQGEGDDPWEIYEFIQNEEEKTGNESHYLWVHPIEEVQENIGQQGGTVEEGRNTVVIPPGVLSEVLIFNLKNQPIVEASASLTSAGTSFSVTAKDFFGNIITQFSDPIDIIIDYSGWDLSRFDPSTLSIYSSPDGIEWAKENTVFDYFEHTASAQVSHFTHFALMGERIDTISPETNLALLGDEGEPGWFRSDVAIRLDAADNAGGLGVDYTFYNLDGMGWTEYTGDISVVGEGEHVIQYYSADLDENIEDIKSSEFFIDKTSPKLHLNVTPTTIWPPDGKLVVITIEKSLEEENVKSKRLFLMDEYFNFTPYDLGIDDASVLIQAKRNGGDIDGRVYIIKFTVDDLAGNVSSVQQEVRVLHDQGN